MAKLSTTPGGLLVPQSALPESVSPSIGTGAISKAKAAAKKSLERRMRAAEANQDFLKGNPYVWKPGVEYDPAKVPEHVGNVTEAVKPLSEDENKEFETFMDFLAETLMGRVDRWVEAGFYNGSWNFFVKDGDLSLEIDPEVYDGMQRQHIADQVWDAINQVPNRYFSIEGK